MAKEGKEKLLVVGLHLVFGYGEIWFCLFGIHILPIKFSICFLLCPFVF